MCAAPCVLDASPQEIRETWERLIQSHEELSPFLCPQWYQVLGKRIPEFHSSPLLIDTGLSNAVLPLVSSPWHLWMRVFESGPWATYGGVVTPQSVLISEGTGIFRSLISAAYPTLRITTPPGSTQVDGADSCIERETRIVDLHAGYENLVEQSFTRQMRAGIRKAQESGVTVRPSSSNDDDRAFLELYRLSRQRWGGSEGFPDSFLMNWSGEDQQFARLWLAWLDSKPVAGALVLYGRRQAHYVAGAGDAAAFSNRPNHLLFAKIIEDACRRGFLNLNLGSSAGIAGVERFKSQMGGVAAKYVTAAYDHPCLRGLRKVRGR